MDAAARQGAHADRRFWRSVLIFWLIASAIMIAVGAGAIGGWQFPDPDDQMRLLEVRDWLGGQAWSDVTQYRLNAPAGVPMHWSRLVDVPIAGVMVALRPLVGTHVAETAALVVVPLATLGVVLAALAVLARRLLPDEAALLAVCLSTLCIDVVQKVRPMRIDHHGWQMALALVAAAALLERGRRAGLVGGLAIALWLTISLEGLPMVAALLALAGLRWAIDPREAPLLRGTVGSAAAAAGALFALTHPPAAWLQVQCDAVAPVHLAILAVAAAGCLTATLIPFRTATGRLAALGTVGVGALAAVPLMAPQCLAGPFGQLDPLVRTLWYRHIKEGLPIWDQTLAVAIGTVAVPIVGLIGSTRVMLAAGGGARRRWASLLFLQLAAVLTAIAVQRSAGVADLIAMPGVLRLVYPLLLRARALPSKGRQALATLGALMIATPGLAADVALKMIGRNLSSEGGGGAVHAAGRCADGHEMAALAAVPRGTVLAPLDVSPAILLLTRHAAVASDHHRGAAAMHDVIAAFTGPAAAAEAIVRRRHVDYVAFCPGLAEVINDEQAAPHGFMAALDAGRTPRWLAPVAIPGSPVKVWRVR